MKVIIIFIFIFLIFYFIWQFIKRTIFFKIFKTFQNFPQNNKAYQEERETQTKKNREFKKDIKWDAETIEFEEIPDSNQKSK